MNKPIITLELPGEVPELVIVHLGSQEKRSRADRLRGGAVVGSIYSPSATDLLARLKGMGYRPQATTRS